MLNAFYGALILLGLIDIGLITPALRSADNLRTTGRLIATLFVLAGLVLAAGGRVADNHLFPRIGLALVDVGLLGYTVFLPDRGVLVLLDRCRTRRGRRRGKGRAS